MKDIFIKKVFSIENKECPQIVIAMSDGIFWSCARTSSAEGWNAMPCKFNEKNHSIDWFGSVQSDLKRFKGFEKLSGRTFEDLETSIWEFVNMEKL